MHAAFLVEGSDSFAITVGEQPRPTPGEGEVLVRVCAAGITPTELEWYPTTHTREGAERLQTIPAHEFSGIVHEAGPGVTEFRAGDEIFGMNDWFAQGAVAEYCVAQPAGISLKPKSLTHAQAATVPIAALTAWQGLFQRAKLEAGERVLVLGGAGAVGAYAIQLAKMHGADVVATCGAADVEFVRALGADEVFDYRATAVQSLPAEMDVLFDAVGGATLQQAWGRLRQTGRAVTIVESEDARNEPRAKAAFFIVEPHQEQLGMVATLIDGGFLKTFVGAVVPLQLTGEAFARRVERGDGRGKVVVDPRLP